MMDTTSGLNWLPQQAERLQKFDVPRLVDVHCHCLPGLDDGPHDMPSAVALCRALANDGITTVIATPHQLGRYDRLNSAAAIREAIDELIVELAVAAVPLEIVAGGDVRIDERLPKLLDAGEVGSVADAGRHLLLELPHELFVDPRPTIEMLQQRGMQAIMTHPERHRYLIGKDEVVESWVDAGAAIQITAGSLLGDFGRRALDQAWRMVDRGLASLVATDAHDARRRPPRMSEALAALTCEVNRETARAICVDNPLRVLQGKAVESP